MTTRADIPLPGWPALLDLEMACAYLSLGEHSFRTMAARQGLRPVETGHRVVRWRRADLDVLIDKLPVQSSDAGAESAEPVLVDPAADGLRRVGQLGRRGARGR